MMTNKDYLDPYKDIEQYYEGRLPPPPVTGEYTGPSCGFCGMNRDDRPGMVLKVYRDGYPEKFEWLCDVCANSHGGNAAFYPNLYKDDATVLRMIAECTNLILNWIEQSKGASEND